MYARPLLVMVPFLALGCGGAEESPPEGADAAGAEPDSAARRPDAAAEVARPLADSGGEVADVREKDAAPANADAGPDGAALAEAGAPAALGPAGAACPPGPYGDPLPATRNATAVSRSFVFTEGPVWVAAQKALYFTEFTGVSTDGRIHKYTPADGMFRVVVNNVGVNGLAVDQNGQLVGAQHDMQRLTRFDPATGARSAIPGGSMYMGRPFNSVNDVVVRADGNIYFTDPTYQRGNRPGQDAVAYYRLSLDGVVNRLEAHDMANAIGISPDGKWLYVSVEARVLRRAPLEADGSVGPSASFITAAMAGIAIDCAGNLYLSAERSVRVYRPDGQFIGAIGGFDDNVSNAAFGGEDGRTLYVTGQRALYRIALGVPGLPN
jgi:gluconolactonase